MKFTSGPGIGTRAEAETDAAGSAVFTNLGPGFNSTAVSEGQGYAGLSAWCDYYVSASGSAGELGRFTAQPVYAWLAPGYTTECSFFTVPYLDPVTVNIRAYVCLEENDYAGATLEQILFNCGPGAPGLRYRVSSEGNESATPGVEPYSVEQATTGSELVVFEEVPVGELSIAELAPYYGAVRFFCGTVEGGSSQLPASYDEPEIVNEAISFSATAPGSDVHCYVISLKLKPVNIGINAYVCLPYYEFEVAELEYLGLNCQVASGVPFTVFSSDGSSEARGSTSVAGLAVFENAPPNSVDLTEGAPDRRTVRVFCGTAASGINTLAFESDTATYLAAPGTNVVCHWFTIDTTYARVVVAKNICPEDYIPEDPTYAGALQNCPTPLPNVTFHFSEPAGEPYEDITDEEGFILLDEVNPGPITITEAPPDDLKGALVYCREVAPGVAEPEFAPVSVEGSSINQQTVGGNLLECHWFNYGTPSPTPTPTVTPTHTPTATPEVVSDAHGRR